MTVAIGCICFFGFLCSFIFVLRDGVTKKNITLSIMLAGSSCYFLITGCYPEQLTLRDNELQYKCSVCYVLAEKVADDNPGRKVLAIYDKTLDLCCSKTKNLFRSSLEKRGCTIVEKVIENPDAFTADSYQRMVREVGNVDSVVLFSDSYSILPSSRRVSVFRRKHLLSPRLYLGIGDFSLLKQIRRRGSIAAMCMWKSGVTFSDSDAPVDYRAAFDQRYVLVTHRNVDLYCSEME